MAPFVSHRYFQVWSLSPSHNVLSLRSNPSWLDESTTRIEILVWHVEALMIKPQMTGLRIARARGAEHQRACRKFGVEAEAGSLFLLESEGFSGFLVSGTPQWREAVRGIGDPSLFVMPMPDLEAGGGSPWELAADIVVANID